MFVSTKQFMLNSKLMLRARNSSSFASSKTPEFFHLVKGVIRKE